MIYVDGNPCPGLGKAQKCSMLKRSIGFELFLSYLLIESQYDNTDRKKQ
jgi:hypothetical protein